MKTAATVETSAPTSATQTLSLKGLMGMSGNQTCTFDDSTSGSSGSVYISSGKMRGDFSAKKDTTETTSHVLSDGTTMYMWSDNQTKGFKVALSSMEKMQASITGTPGSTNTVDVNREANYHCSGWNVDASKFTVPATITFTDYSQMMENAGKMMTTGVPTGAMMQNNAAACAACNNLTGAAQTSCKTALKCQ